MTEIMKVIKGFIEEINEYIDIEIDTQLIDEGILDSLGIMVLINEIEDYYGIEILSKDIQSENFKNLVTIESLVKRYKG
ncbi:acyl carrier protein [Oceanirhabdus seepicola]|uniref:Acyl carrier protein n=1 Tax=Oceanirhabdus seepicola TaxID=2828781 RepID=A0A9J6P7K1_9CLOT|nr:acyl carrier protein [Oceanirhabdus seepicola]MCM1992627.1 acyl carrier protein [Oceanirhabdus seepicola]